MKKLLIINLLSLVLFVLLFTIYKEKPSYLICENPIYLISEKMSFQDFLNAYITNLKHSNYESGKPICVRIGEREEFTIQLGRYSIIEADELRLHDFFLGPNHRINNSLRKFTMYPIYFNDMESVANVDGVIQELREHFQSDVNVFPVLYVREDIPIVRLIKLLNTINDLCGIRYAICLLGDNQKVH